MTRSGDAVVRPVVLGLLKKAGQQFFSLWYPYALMGSELAGQRETRRQLVGRARGEVLEIGAGSGFNIPHYTSRVSRLVISDPSRPMLTRLRRVLASPPPVGAWQLDVADAERLPYPDNSFDTVVATFVFCSVSDPDRAFREVNRVLRPGGCYLFLEHVRAAPGTALGRFQDLMEMPTRVLAAGCYPNRVVADMLEASPLRVEEMVAGTMPRAFPAFKPTIRGLARAS